MRSTIIAVCLSLSLLVLMGSAFGEGNRWESVPKPKTVSDTEDRLQQGPQQEMPSVDIERQQRMISVLKKPPVPLKTPDKILRVLFLPYVDQNNILNNYKYSFMKVEEGKWVIGDYLLPKLVHIGWEKYSISLSAGWLFYAEARRPTGNRPVPRANCLSSLG